MSARRACLAVLILLLACETPPDLKNLSQRCDAYWVKTGDMGEPFRADYEMEARSGRAHVPFRMIAEFDGQTLELVGYDRVGAQVVAVRQGPLGITVPLPPRRAFPLDPVTLMGVVHRVRFLGKAEPDGEGGFRVRACGITFRGRES